MFSAPTQHLMEWVGELGSTNRGNWIMSSLICPELLTPSELVQVLVTLLFMIQWLELTALREVSIFRTLLLHILHDFIIKASRHKDSCT